MANRSSSNQGGMFFKTGIFALLAALAYWFFSGNSPQENPGENPSARNPETTERPEAQSRLPGPSEISDELLPESGGETVRHQYYALGYNEDHEQAEWVVYTLTRKRLNSEWVERPGGFMPDPLVRTESATPRDYSNSGYDKGHLCAAADMAFSDEAIAETFYMSNISPQIHAYNGGIWRELEETVRDWAKRFSTLHVVTGPVLDENPGKQIGFSKVTVPNAYYKVLYAPEVGKAIGFIVPHAISEQPLMEYACSIDAVEEATGINFFPKMLNGLDEELEGSLDQSAWPISSKRYRQRVEQWNKR